MRNWADVWNGIKNIFLDFGNHWVIILETVFLFLLIYYVLKTLSENNAKKFITKGNKVKITLRFRGREMAHVQQSRHILDDFAELLKDIAVVEKQPKLEGRSMSMVLTEKR